MTSLYASEIECHFSNPDRDVTELFPDATYAHLAGLFTLVSRDISINFCVFCERRFAAVTMV